MFDAHTLPSFTVSGTVVTGEGRGRQLGFRTANVKVPGDGAAPPYGIYAGFADGHAAAISVGVRPTFGDGLEPLIEAHLLDFDGDLYGKSITIELMHRIRDEVQFDSAEALRAQIRADIAAVRDTLRLRSPGDTSASPSIRSY